jgi:hypothetical protein
MITAARDASASHAPSPCVGGTRSRTDGVSDQDSGRDNPTDASTVASWRTLCLILLGAFLGMSVIVYGVRLLPSDVDLHREERRRRGNISPLRHRSPPSWAPTP